MIAPLPDDQLDAAAAELQLATSEPDVYNELPAEPAAAEEVAGEAPELAEALCPHCGELLAWHDEFAACAARLTASTTPASEPQPVPLDEPATGRTHLLWRPGPKANFAYELGRVVQPTPAVRAQIIWRGQLKERHPDTGLVHRVNVYRLNDGYWDCYREEELRAA